MTYSNGLVTQETHNIDGFTEVTTWEYSASVPPAFIKKKTTLTQTGKIEVTYDTSGNDLVTETEKEYESESVVRTRLTRHYPLGQGHWGTTIEENGVTVSTTIGQGSPSSKASPYSIRENSINAPVITTPGSNVVIYTIPARLRSLMDEYPVTDIASLQAIADALVWLDGKIEERISMEVYDDTILDYTSRVIWRGNEYYLESNNITQEPEKFSQRVELVRWYA